MILFNIDRVINILGANKNQEVYKYVKEYLTIIVFFSVFYMSGYAFEIYIKIDGKPSYPAICVLVGGFTNLILDYVFVVIFNYGVTGAAIATGISQVISCTMLFLYIAFSSPSFCRAKTLFTYSYLPRRECLFYQCGCG